MGRRKTKIETKYMWLRYTTKGALRYLQHFIDDPSRASDPQWREEAQRYINRAKHEHRFRSIE